MSLRKARSIAYLWEFYLNFHFIIFQLLSQVKVVTHFLKWQNTVDYLKFHARTFNQLSVVDLNRYVD